MWVYYEEIDGELQPKWLILKARTNEQCSYYYIDGPYNRMYDGDMYDMTAYSISLKDINRDPLQENCLIISNIKLEQSLKRNNYDETMIHEIDYYIILIEDVQELLNYETVTKIKKEVC
ncbi:hypothetical protein ACM26V_00175 [Salipaludibacillus sp. HK11]|uniref:hypothetical protein n=1 Tax=Salipaludibacillus sp. HK11 TaxID=3394320 RepID=UPI0039FC95CD